MKKSYKKIGIVLAIIFIAIFILSFFVDDYVEGKVAEQIKNVPSHIAIDYESMDFSTFKGNLVFKNSQIKFKDPDFDSLVATISINDVSVLDIGYWEYISNGNFVIDRLEINSPEINHRILDAKKDTTKIDSESGDPWKNKLRINNLVINDAKINVNDFESDSLVFSTSNSSFEVKDVLIDSTMGDLIPFKYASYKGELNDLYYKLGEYEDLNVKKAVLSPKKSMLSQIKLKTKYDRSSYDAMLRQERDWFNISLDSLELVNTSFGKVNDSIISFASDSTIIHKPYVNIYRNKLLPDENEIKPFYSELLRDLDFNLTLNLVELQNGFVSYEEKVIAEHKPGKLDFQNFYASVYNFSNTYAEGEKTKIDVRTDFMETTPLKVAWSFDYRDESDEYIFEGDLASINTSVLNQFTNRNLNAKLEGTLNQTYFTISGNNRASNIDIKLNYDDFRVELINDKRNKPKKLLNAIVNIFVRKDSDESTNDFREGSAQIERNKYGSFYNNLWLNLSAGIKKAITGSPNDGS